jgi:hypothetical protein
MLERWESMKAKHGIVAALLAVLAVSSPTKASADVIDDAKASVRLHLIFPDSAKFDNLHPRGDYICGTVAAETSTGGHSGPKVLIYNTKTQLSTIVDGSQISRLMTDTMKRDLEHACS